MWTLPSARRQAMRGRCRNWQCSGRQAFPCLFLAQDCSSYPHFFCCFGEAEIGAPAKLIDGFADDDFATWFGDVEDAGAIMIDRTERGIGGGIDMKRRWSGRSVP